jgi:hypothetical protein
MRSRPVLRFRPLANPLTDGSRADADCLYWMLGINSTRKVMKWEEYPLMA